jgi:flagellar motor switch/type III secretory pathway protein FliN
MDLSAPAAPHHGAAHPPGLPRLARLQPGAVALQQHLLVAVPCSDWPLGDGDGDGGVVQSWRWCADSPPRSGTDGLEAAVGPAGTVLVLADGADECLLCLQHESSVGIDPRVDLAAFDGEALLLAATLRYAGVLAHLCAITARDWQCLRVQPAADAWAAGLLSSDLTAIGFTLRYKSAAGVSCASDADADESASPTTRGQVHVHHNDRPRWHRAQGRPAAAPAVLQALTVALPIVVPSAALTVAELRGLQVGAALLMCRAEAGAVGPAPACACVLRVSAHLPAQLAAVLQGQQLRITGPWRTAGASDAVPGHPSSHPPHQAPARRHPMLDHPAEGDPGDHHGSNDHGTASNALNKLPIALEFQLGQLQLPLADLAQQLVPGAVFDLGQPLGPHSVVVCANGMELARGELLQVGDLLAVRITAVSAGVSAGGGVYEQSTTPAGGPPNQHPADSETATRGPF